MFRKTFDGAFFDVHRVLRQPGLYGLYEMRSDPFWEFGSFGCTGCHRQNLLNPMKVHRLEPAKLPFAQGGPAGFKLVFLSPPIKVVHHPHVCEVRVHFRVETEASAETLRELTQFSPVYEMVSRSVPVDVTIETY